MYFNISVMKMHVVHEATDDTEQRSGLLLILLLVSFSVKLVFCRCERRNVFYLCV